MVMNLMSGATSLNRDFINLIHSASLQCFDFIL